MTERIVSAKPQEEDLTLETSLRPRKLADYVGQDKVKASLSISIEAARGRGEPLDHVLLYGPPGLGKTTLAYIIAAEMQVSIRVTSGPAIERIGDLAAILTSLQTGDMLFIDEIHRLSLIRGTTRYAMMSPPLRDRFGHVYRLDFHDVDALSKVIRRSASIIGV